MSNLKLIKKETLEAIADKTREMSGSGQKMSTDDILYWLGRVKYVPQGVASSELILDFDINASGVIVEN